MRQLSFREKRVRRELKNKLHWADNRELFNDAQVVRLHRYEGYIEAAKDGGVITDEEADTAYDVIRLTLINSTIEEADAVTRPNFPRIKWWEKDGD